MSQRPTNSRHSGGRTGGGMPSGSADCTALRPRRRRALAAVPLVAGRRISGAMALLRLLGLGRLDLVSVGHGRQSKEPSHRIGGTDKRRQVGSFGLDAPLQLRLRTASIPDLDADVRQHQRTDARLGAADGAAGAADARRGDLIDLLDALLNIENLRGAGRIWLP